MARIDKIKQALKGLEPEDKIGLHNLRNSEMGYSDDDIYPNDEDFFNMYYSNDPYNAVQRAVYGNYQPMQDYVMFDGYGNLKSLDTYELEKYMSDDELAEFLDENEQYIEDYLEVEDEEANEVSEEAYYDSLEVLPPYYFDTLNGKKVSGGFAVGEASNHRETPDGFKATYSGFYKSGDKYFGIGEVYFLKTDGMGEPTGYSDDDRDAKTLNPDAFGNGGGVRKVNGKYYPIGSSWTKEHKYENKSSKYEVPQTDRKRKFAGGGGTDDFRVDGFYTLSNSGGYEIMIHPSGDSAKVRDAYGSENPKTSDWLEIEWLANPDIEENDVVSEDEWNVPIIDPNGYNIPLHSVMNLKSNNPNTIYAKGGGLKKPTYIPNEDIESLKTNYGQTISGRKLLDGAYATGKVKKPTMSRTQFEDESYEYGNGGFVSKGELVWKKITDSTKAEFLYENFTPQITPRTQEILVGKSWNFLPKDVKIVFQSKYANVEDYGTGGGLRKAPYKVGDMVYSYQNPNHKMRISFVEDRGISDGVDYGWGIRVALKTDANGKYDPKGSYSQTSKFMSQNSVSKTKKVKYETGGNVGTGGTMDSSTFKKGGYTPKEPIAFSSSNLYFNGYAMDINGNSVVRVSFPNSRAFSIQTNGTLPKTNNAYGTIGFDESEINSYVKSYGSPAQKKKLKIYKK